LKIYSFFLQFYDTIDCCSLYGGWVGYGLGWVWVDDMDPRTTLLCNYPLVVAATWPCTFLHITV